MPDFINKVFLYVRNQECDFILFLKLLEHDLTTPASIINGVFKLHPMTAEGFRPEILFQI